MVNHKFKVGDVVHICNPYGIYLGKQKIIALDERSSQPTYYYEDSDTPWFFVEENCLSENGEEILELMWNRLTNYRKGMVHVKD